MVRGFGLDIIVPILTFPNRWHYIFTGEYIDFENGRNYHKNIDFITADILVDVCGKSVIYSGLIDYYYLSNTTTGLDSIILKYPSKKNFSISGRSVYRDIPGDYLVIPYDKVINLNFQYFELKDLESVDEGKRIMVSTFHDNCIVFQQVNVSIRLLQKSHGMDSAATCIRDDLVKLASSSL